MLKVYIYCLLSFVFGNSFLLATLTKKTTKPTKEPIVLTDKQTALIKKQMMSTEDPTTLTNEEIQKIKSARAVMYDKIINTLETKPYVEGINEAYNLLCQPIPVEGFPAMKSYKVPLIGAVLQWFSNILQRPLPENEKDEKISQATLIDLMLFRLDSNKMVHFFQRYIGSFWVYPGINDDQVKEIVIDKLSELKKQVESQGIKRWLIKCIDVQLDLLRNDRYQRAIIFI